jgi:hypothetical protein
VSNFLSIAMVTAALKAKLEKAISDDANVSSAPVRISRPDKPPKNVTQGAFLYMYQSMPNAALRSLDLPTRRADGSTITKPTAALNLYYLISFFGDDTALVPQRLMGSVVRALHSEPYLPKWAIDAGKAATPELASSDLENSIEMVRFTPVSLSLEDLAKLWSVFYQIPYLLSVAYEASVVFVEDNPPSQPSLPVQMRGLYSTTFTQPVLESAAAASGDDQPVVPGSTLMLRGRALKSDSAIVRLGGVEGAPSLVSDARVSVVLAVPGFAPGSLRAGIQPVSVVQSQSIGPDARLVPIAESNAVAVVLRPVITAHSVAAGPVLHLEFDPPLGLNQRASVVLSPAQGNPAAPALIDVPLRDADAVKQLDVTIPATIPHGKYLLVFRVDGADSVLTADTTPGSPTYGQFIGPAVTI